MADDLEVLIVQALRQKPGQTAAEIARELRRDRTEVNQRLYGHLSDQVRQDRTYRWHLAASDQSQSESPATREEPRFANTDLAKLARYYLACLGYDDAGISTFLTSRYGHVDYVELKSLPRSRTELTDNAAARQLLSSKRTDRARYDLYLGYPTAIKRMRSRRSDWEGLMVEPLLLFRLEEEAESGRLILDLGFPIVNQKPLQAFTNSERDMVMTELVQLEHELGLTGEGDPPELDELALRLHAIRQEWPWRESIHPEALSGVEAPIAELTEQGIYNRAVLIMAEGSPFTQGLEQELRELARLPEDRYAGTALGRWLGCSRAPASEAEETCHSPLLEVLPMNSEQREAVLTALTRPVTVITGPPGTGKSQVVTNLLVNAAWRGKRVLFASKNNKAVDVVETRANALGPRPILLRVGGQAYQARLAEYVLGLLAATSTESERQDFEEVRSIHDRLLEEHQRLANEANALVALRNEVDHLEQAADDSRRRLPACLFAGADKIDVIHVQHAIDQMNAAVDRADRARAPLLGRLLWPLARRGRFGQLARAATSVTPAFASVGVAVDACAGSVSGLEHLRELCSDARRALADVSVAANYRARLQALRRARPLEEMARLEAGVLHRIAQNSAQLWKLWLRLQPSKMTPEQRQRLGRYTAVLKMVIEAGEEGELSKAARDEYRKLFRDVSPLLSCWAVTSLSARGRIQFEPGIFDIVIFDEASQCDIASALPLLYRAKSIVVIGDPKQLSHISGLPRGQDQALLTKHGLFPLYADWAYSYQSLFALASTKVKGDEIIGLFDHHRSHADIINFANKEFYEERLRVATRYDRLKSPSRGEPGIRWIDVKGRAVRPAGGGAVNATEGRAAVDVLRDLLVSKRYAGTVGVVTPFRAQANAITESVNRDDVLAAALIRAEFLADTVHKFQGDERDVMVFSPVVAAGISDGALGFLSRNPNLFNVAITRARAQLLVVGDRAACIRSGIGYLARFAEYSVTLDHRAKADLQECLQDIGPEYPPVANPDLVSEWERILYRALYRADLRPIPQYPVEKYLLDLLLIDGERRLAIEVDGERYHRNWNGELCRRDQIRNQRLFELGYDVMRFWVYEVRDELADCVDRVQAWYGMQS